MAYETGVARDDLDDLILAARRHLPITTFVETFDKTNYEVMSYFLASGNVERKVGRGISERVRVNEKGTAQHVAPYQWIDLSQNDVLAKFEVDFVRATEHFLISDDEVLENMGEARAEKVVDLYSGRRAAAYESLGNLIEEAFVASPDASDERKPWGLLYWIVKRDAAGAGHDGGNPSGFSDVGGIDSDTVARWNNYAAGGTGYYSDVDDEFIDSLASGLRKTSFKAPARMVEGRDPDQRFRVYTNDTMLNLLARRARNQTDDVGADLGRFEGDTYYKRNLFRYLEGLDDDTDNPVYGLDLATWRFIVHREMDLKERDPMRNANQPDVAVVHVDHKYLFACENRRRNFVIHKI